MYAEIINYELIIQKITFFIMNFFHFFQKIEPF
jgi:hypothetical protein